MLSDPPVKQTPNVSGNGSFCFASKQCRKRHHLPPAGVTIRRQPALVSHLARPLAGPGGASFAVREDIVAAMV